jgi:predicted nucleotidyltransferase
LTLFSLTYRIERMKTEKFNIEKFVNVLKPLLLNNTDILFAYLHGSALHQDDFNDIDIAVYLAREATINNNPVDFEISLSLHLEKYLHFPIDIKILNFAPLSFCYHATKGILIFSINEDAREEFLCRTWSDYFDFKPTSQIFLKEAVVARVQH